MDEKCYDSCCPPKTGCYRINSKELLRLKAKKLREKAHNLEKLADSLDNLGNLEHDADDGLYELVDSYRG